MYASFFNLREMPFSITPDPAFLFLSPRHQEALGHLLYGTGQFGGFVQITGEVGTGKTTVIRTLLDQRLEGVEVAMIHNPRQSELEFVQSICDELRVPYERPATLKSLIDALNAYLLEAHAAGRRTVLIIDEAQNLAPDVLEQVRLLTNLETAKQKLLRIMLVGQPELAALLARPELRQLASRITARYHLTPLDDHETSEYIRHRLRVAGTQEELFPPDSASEVQRYSRGIPRLINVICDRALLGAYGRNERKVQPELVRGAAEEALGTAVASNNGERRQRTFFGLLDRRNGFGLPRLSLTWLEGTLMGLALMIGGALLYQTVIPLMIGRPGKVAAVEPEKVPPPKPAAPVIQLQPPVKPATSPIGVLFDPEVPLPSLMSLLIRQWDAGISVPRGDKVCGALKRQGLECYRTTGDLDDLREINRPAILTLTDDAGQTRYGLVTRQDSMALRFETPDGSFTIATADVVNAWTGEMLLLWKRETSEVQLRPGMRGAAVLWLRDRLTTMMGKSPDEKPSDRFDEGLAEEVREFQRARGLDNDGSIGVRTRIALSDPVPNTPRLVDLP